MAKGWRKSKKAGTKEKGQAARRDERAAAAAAAERQAAAEAMADMNAAPTPAPNAAATPATAVEPAYQPSMCELNAFKRMAVVYFYMTLGCPPETEWGKHGGTLRQIADHLGMPDPCDYTHIRSTLTRHLAGEDIWHNKPGQGRKRKLTKGEALIYADCLKRGHGRDQSTHILNAIREKKGKDVVSVKACRTGFTQTLGGRILRCGTRGTHRLPSCALRLVSCELRRRPELLRGRHRQIAPFPLSPPNPHRHAPDMGSAATSPQGRPVPPPGSFLVSPPPLSFVEGSLPPTRARRPFTRPLRCRSIPPPDRAGPAPRTRPHYSDPTPPQPSPPPLHSQRERIVTGKPSHKRRCDGGLGRALLFSAHRRHQRCPRQQRQHHRRLRAQQHTHLTRRSHVVT